MKEIKKHAKQLSSISGSTLIAVRAMRVDPETLPTTDVKITGINGGSFKDKSRVMAVKIENKKTKKVSIKKAFVAKEMS